MAHVVTITVRKLTLAECVAPPKAPGGKGAAYAAMKAALDPNVAKILALMAVGGGCLGCGSGNSS